MKDTLTNPPMASLPAGRKKLPSGWWRGDFPPGSTLLARELTRQLRARRGYARQDERLQREARAFALWAWRMQSFEDLREAGHV